MAALLAAMLTLSGAFPVTAVAAGEGGDDAADRIGAGDAAAGAGKAAARGCSGCHAAGGGAAPVLAGQFADYIVAQLAQFRVGQRKGPPIEAHAAAIGEAEAADIAAFYAAAAPAHHAAPPDNAVARLLFTKGDRSRDILPCVSCHGPDGRGAVSGSDTYPSIAGQDRDYLHAQLVQWRAGTRGEGGSVMKIIARSLSDAEIDALSSYISGL